jgi:hypothetical protein
LRSWGKIGNWQKDEKESELPCSSPCWTARWALVGLSKQRQRQSLMATNTPRMPLP